ncbi:MAG: DUF1570 domain-containing protein [Rubinisphaera brasiliensis]|uniref:DUF1570 domain-containing protein n=1 Tax=Rubinisphaera brasiliensis TaxID=119 RepID=UPI003919AB39
MQHLTFGRRFSCSLLLERIPHRCSVSSGVNFLFAGLSSLKRRYAVEQTALIAFSIACFGGPESCLADRFRLATADGSEREIVGRLHGSGQGAYAIERPDGQLEVVSQAAVLERDNTVEWTPATPEEMAANLAEEFGEDRFRSQVQGNFVIGMVMMAPLPKQSESRVVGFMRKASQFMNNVENVFVDFTRDLRLEFHDPEVPLVLLIFESDDDFDRYTDSITQGQGLSSQNIAGFYNAMTNYLAIRMTECDTFEVPLHEAIHQQVYNRGILQRLAKVPAWFNEGIAAGFEANGGRINSGPTKVHSRYAERYPDARQVTWDDLIVDDLAFRGDVLAGDAYCHGWALHWLLVTKHQEEYAAYVKMLGKKEPLAKEDLKVREQDFREHFGDDLEALKQEFVRSLQRAMRTQRIARNQNSRPGYLRTQEALADLEVTALVRQDRGGYLEVQGRLKNINPFRSLVYQVTIVTQSGTFARWVSGEVGSNRTYTLNRQYANQLEGGGIGPASSQFRVRVDSGLPGSEKVNRWRRGEFDTPEF